MTSTVETDGKHANTLLLQCPVCQSDDAETIGVTGAMSGSLASTVLLVCGNCRAVYLSPPPTSNGEEPELGETYRKVFDATVRHQKQKVPSATKFIAADVGEASILAQDPAAGRFDQILLPLTLEGSNDPVALMQHVAALLEDHGRLEVVCANPDSSSFGLFGGRHWCGYRFPDTRQQLGIDSMRSLATKSGLSIAEYRTASSPSSWLISARHALIDWKVNRVVRGVLTGPWLVPWLFAWLLESIAVMRGRGSVLVLQLEKNDGETS